jgi:hypothetical protein
MAAETEALARCSECGNTYAVFKDGEEWRVLGTDGDCSCGNGEFNILSSGD